jgi:sulfoxide reductase catalytic subunit YedY
MLIKRPADIPSSEITSKGVYLSRRAFVRAATAAGVVGATGLLGSEAMLGAQAAAPHGRELTNVKPSPFSTTEKLNTWGELTTYNNFEEMGPDKNSASIEAKHLKPEPWSVAVEGECEKPGVWHLEDILKGVALEERIYRLRCVEAWSMVVPWNGFPLADFIRRCEPTSRATFVEFTSLADPQQMPGVRIRPQLLPWPYREGLRMDEAMHPLTILAVGMYSEALPNTNGAPLRVVVPWKYGFKSAKSIIKVRFVEKQPATAWGSAVPDEYGFYANVNPKVSHPRWSQAREIRLPGLFAGTATQMFNGYGDQVASLYSGMDLKKNF